MAKTGTAISRFTVDVWHVSLFVLAVIGSSFIYTWMFNNTSRSLFIAILLHLSMNSSGTITGMLFPLMDEGNELMFYQYYVIVVWALVLTGRLIIWKRQQAINGYPL